MKDKWLYDIITEDGYIALDNGEINFPTEEEARHDALNSIDDELCKEYKTGKHQFVIKCYKAIY